MGNDATLLLVKLSLFCHYKPVGWDEKESRLKSQTSSPPAILDLFSLYPTDIKSRVTIRQIVLRRHCVTCQGLGMSAYLIKSTQLVVRMLLPSLPVVRKSCLNRFLSPYHFIFKLPRLWLPASFYLRHPWSRVRQ